MTLQNLVASGCSVVKMVNVFPHPGCVITILTVVMEVTKPGLTVQVSFVLKALLPRSCRKKYRALPKFFIAFLL